MKTNVIFATILATSLSTISGFASDYIPHHPGGDHTLAKSQVVQHCEKQNAPDCSKLTPLDQSEDTADLKITQKIRQALIDDSMLSVNAKNIKIITVNGHVTLRGPVESKQEKQIVVAKARQIAGALNVENFIDTAH
ncbi:MAG: BON domain-containing protein [Parachlamydiales bacterium]|nr:BON domain-containing protein [Parachlamydiales bacterium]